MPEISETRIIGEGLREVILNKNIIGIEYDDKSRFSKEGIVNLNLLEFPYICEEVYMKGKRIIVRLSSGVHLLFFLGMTGKFVREEGRHSDLKILVGSITNLSNKKLRIIRDVVYFDDTRHFGYLKVYLNKEDLDEYLSGAVGFDLFDDPKLGDYREIIINPRRKNVMVSRFLLNQKLVSGVGTYLCSEILYRSKIRPDRILSSLCERDIQNLFNNSVNLAQESYEAKGLTIQSYVNPDGSKGTFRCSVYGRKEDDLGNKILSEDFGSKRNIYYCPKIQV